MLQDVLTKMACLLDLGLVRPSPTRSFFTFVTEGSMRRQTAGVVWHFVLSIPCPEQPLPFP
jgi:hypothetical protein